MKIREATNVITLQPDLTLLNEDVDRPVALGAADPDARRALKTPVRRDSYFAGFTNLSVNRSLSPMAAYFSRSLSPSR
jgi:hypothetical protein